MGLHDLEESKWLHWIILEDPYSGKVTIRQFRLEGDITTITGELSFTRGQWDIFCRQLRDRFPEKF